MAAHKHSSFYDHKNKPGHNGKNKSPRSPLKPSKEKRRTPARDDVASIALQKSEIGLWHYNPSKGELFWSDGHLDLFHLPKDFAPTFEKWISLLPEEDAAQLAKALRGQRQGPLSVDYQASLPDGKVHHFRTSGEIFPDGKKSLRAVGNTIDITDLKLEISKLEGELHCAHEAIKSKSEFLAKINHEMRTPLNSIISPIELLRDETNPRVRNELIDMLSTSGQSLVRMVHDILNLATAETGKMALVPENVDLRKLVSETVGQFTATAVSRAINLTYEISPFAPTLIRTDSARLRQVLSNLLSNSLKFTPKGNVRVFVDARALSSLEAWRINFTVSDTGIGIDPKDQKKLFKPFGRIDSEMSRKHGGTGLGLAICKELCHIMGGDIYFSSHPKEGTTFSFFITTALAADEPTHVDEPKISFDQFSAKFPLRIAIAEDDKTSLRLLQIMLARLGYKDCALARNGVELLDVLRSGFKADVILLDEKMPEMDGHSVIRTIRKNAKGDLPVDVHIISLTAASPETEPTLQNNHANDFLGKPLLLDLLADALKRAHTMIGKPAVTVESEN